jgi:hypothetical protein
MIPRLRGVVMLDSSIMLILEPYVFLAETKSRVFWKLRFSLHLIGLQNPGVKSIKEIRTLRFVSFSLDIIGLKITGAENTTIHLNTGKPSFPKSSATTTSLICKTYH